MKYYVVNYIVLDRKTVTKNENIGISLPTFANIDDFKKSIVAMKNVGEEKSNIVIKSYKQISEEAYFSLKASRA